MVLIRRYFASNCVNINSKHSLKPIELICLLQEVAFRPVNSYYSLYMWAQFSRNGKAEEMTEEERIDKLTCPGRKIMGARIIKGPAPRNSLFAQLHDSNADADRVPASRDATTQYFFII